MNIPSGTTPGELAMIERLVSVETKLDLLREEIGPRMKDHEDRIRRMEAKLWMFTGASLLGGGILGTFAAHLTGA
jgi:hypothetical protein